MKMKPHFNHQFSFAVTFILQFLLLSIIFGIPLFAFHISLGQYLGSGVVDVWRISPIHQVSNIIQFQIIFKLYSSYVIYLEVCTGTIFKGFEI